MPLHRASCAPLRTRTANQVCTRTADDDVGARLTYAPDGRLLEEVKAARTMGTTVTVADIFKPLPVRHREFMKNLKTQLSKLTCLLQAYAIISSGVRITCSDSTDGKRHTVLTCAGGTTMKERAGSVFGPKFLRSLEPLEIDLGEDVGKLTGFISKTGEGVGRSTSDRQFMFINGRPVDMSRITKAVNEVWRQFEMKKKPAFLLDFRLTHCTYDINVTPDKREVFLTNEVRSRSRAGGATNTRGWRLL